MMSGDFEWAESMNFATVEPIPLQMSEGGAIRVADKRVSIDSVVYAFREGASAEEIAD